LIGEILKVLANRKLLLLWVIPLVFLGIFFFYPSTSILKLALQSLLGGMGSINFNGIIKPLTFTIYQASLSTFLTLIVGLPAAYLFGRFDFKGKGILRILATLPFILPTVVVAAGFNSLIGPRGWLNVVLMQLLRINQPPVQLLNSLAAILLAHVFYNTAVVIRTVGSALEQLNPRLEQAGQTLGASVWQSIWKITFPLIRSSIASAALVVFLFDFTSFGVILLLGGPEHATIEVEIYNQTMQLLNLPQAALLSVIQMLFTLILTVLILRGGGGLAVPIAPRIMREPMNPGRTWKVKLFIVSMMLVLIILLVLPLIALVLRSVSYLEIDSGLSNSISIRWTLDFYQELFINRRQSLFYVPPIQALINSILYALTASILALISGLLASYALIQKMKINIFLDPLLMLPMGASAVTLGLGFIVAFTVIPNARSIYPFLIPCAHALIALPFVVRVLQPALSAIPVSLKQAASTLGASPWQVWKRIELPIIMRAVSVATLFSFAISLGEFGATSFLSRPDIPTMPVAIFRFLNLPGVMNYGQALAMATILMMLCTVVMILVDHSREIINFN